MVWLEHLDQLPVVFAGCVARHVHISIKPCPRILSLVSTVYRLAAFIGVGITSAENTILSPARLRKGLARLRPREHCFWLSLMSRHDWKVFSFPSALLSLIPFLQIFYSINSNVIGSSTYPIFSAVPRYRSIERPRTSGRRSSRELLRRSS